MTNIKIVNQLSRRHIISDSDFSEFAQLKKWGHLEGEAIDLVLSHQPYYTMMQHASSSHYEIGGLLVGKVYKRDQKFLVHIEKAIPDKLGESGSATYSFTYKSWARLMNITEEEYSSLRIVGWYHSHPNYGIFYSSVDKESHRTYFPKPWMIGVVVDPVRYTAGLFSIREGERDPRMLSGFYEIPSEDKHNTIRWKNWESTGYTSLTKTKIKRELEPMGEYGIDKPQKKEENRIIKKRKEDISFRKSIFFYLLFIILLFFIGKQSFDINRLTIELQNVQNTQMVLQENLLLVNRKVIDLDGEKKIVFLETENLDEFLSRLELSVDNLQRIANIDDVDLESGDFIIIPWEYVDE